jgi:Tfp pilus assembly protein PilO
MSWRFWKTDASGLAAIAVLSGGAYLAGFRPLLDSWSTKSDLEARLRSEQAAVAAATSDLSRLEAQFDDLSQQIAKLEVTLLDRGRVNQRIGALTDLAKMQKIIVDSAIKNGERNEELFGVVQIRIQARGDYRMLAGFMRALHLRYRDISVRTFEIRTEPSSELPRISIDLDWYVLPESRRKSR